jgi:transcription elongation GreA/GreB family factor
MSRAFVKEGDGSEPVPRPEPELPPGVPNRVTPRGAARFQERLSACRAERASLGGSPLEQARRRELEDELRWLERRISTFVVTPPPSPARRAGFGTRVTLSRGEELRSVSVVGVDEADPSAGAVSFLSPLAVALRGAEVGDEVVVKAPSGDEPWTVESIEALT